MNLDGVEEDLVELDDLVDGFPQFNGYEHFEALGEDDLEDLALIKILLVKKKQLRCILSHKKELGGVRTAAHHHQ